MVVTQTLTEYLMDWSCTLNNYLLPFSPLPFLLTSVALPCRHLPFQQQQFVRVRKQFKTFSNESRWERGVREGNVKERVRNRDEVVGRREEEDEEGGRGWLGCQPSKRARRKEDQVLVVGMCCPWFQGVGSWWGLWRGSRVVISQAFRRERERALRGPRG